MFWDEALQLRIVLGIMAKSDQQMQNIIHTSISHPVRSIPSEGMLHLEILYALKYPIALQRPCFLRPRPANDGINHYYYYYYAIFAVCDIIFHKYYLGSRSYHYSQLTDECIEAQRGKLSSPMSNNL